MPALSLRAKILLLAAVLGTALALVFGTTFLTARQQSAELALVDAAAARITERFMPLESQIHTVRYDIVQVQ